MAELKRTKGGGYYVVRMKDHHRANRDGLVKEHVMVAERALGKPLSSKHPVHHFDYDRSNNENRNLVICEDSSYHMLLHARTRILLSGGDPRYESICFICRKAKSFSEFHKNSSRWNGVSAACKGCHNADGRRRRLIRPGIKSGVGKYPRDRFRRKNT